MKELDSVFNSCFNLIFKNIRVKGIHAKGKKMRGNNLEISQPAGVHALSKNDLQALYALSPTDRLAVE